MNVEPMRGSKANVNIAKAGLAGTGIFGPLSAPVRTRAQLEAELKKGGVVEEAFIGPLAAAYEAAMTQGGGSYKQRGGACSPFQRKWMKYFVLAVIGGGIMYSGAGASVISGAKDMAGFGSFLWGLATGQKKCEVSVWGGAPSDLCTQFGVVTKQLRNTSVVSPAAGTAMVTGWGTMATAGGVASWVVLKSVFARSTAVLDVVVNELCDLAFTPDGTFVMKAFWDGLRGKQEAVQGAAAAAAAAGGDPAAAAEAEARAPLSAAGGRGGYRKTKKQRRTRRKGHKGHKGRKSRRN